MQHGHYAGELRRHSVVWLASASAHPGPYGRRRAEQAAKIQPPDFNRSLGTGMLQRLTN